MQGPGCFELGWVLGFAVSPDYGRAQGDCQARAVGRWGLRRVVARGLVGDNEGGSRASGTTETDDSGECLTMRSAPLAILLGTGLLAFAGFQAGGTPSADGPRLPGARAEILAAEYNSLQEAIDAAGQEGGVVRIPPGHFEIDEPLVVTSPDLLIVGAGTGTHIHNRNEEGKPALVLRAADLGEKPNSRVWRIKLADFRLTGNPKSGHGIEATGVNELYLDGITVSEHGGDGVRMTDCYEDPRIVGCLFTYNKAVGVNLIGCHDIVVSANQFEENQDALRCADGFNLCMTGNCVDDHLRHGVVIENTYGSVVSGNMIEECAGTAVVLSRDCYGITLSANVIAHETGAGSTCRTPTAVL